MSRGMAYSGIAQAAPGQAAFSFSSGTTDWTVPEGVFRISVVCGGYQSSVVINGSTVCRAQNGARIGHGGGNGGPPGGGTDGGGGGGAGGYSGDGGAGGAYDVPSGSGASGSGGGGGGGGGGHFGIHPNPANSSSEGGGTHLYGTGTNGSGGGNATASTASAPGGYGSGPTPGGAPAAAIGGGAIGTQGPALSYTNNIDVVPGSTVQLSIVGTDFTAGFRIIWGDGRSFPSNAGFV